MTRERVIILGAGLTGLSAADELAAAGVPVLVLEAEKHVGGLAGGFRWRDFTFDYGPHRFHTPNPAVRQWFLDLFPDGDYLTPRRRSEIQLVGRRFSYPLELGDVIRKLDLADDARAFADYLVSFARLKLSRPPERSFRDWVENRFGRTLYNLYFGPYTAKLWGLPPEQISLDWAAQRISLVSLFDVLKRLLVTRQGNEPRTYSREFLYPRAGIGELTRRLAERAASRGAELRLGQRTVGIERLSAGWRVRTADGGGENGTRLVSTIPLSVLCQQITTDPNICSGARRLRSRAVVFDHQALAGATPSANHWIYFPEAEYPFNRISETVNFSPEMAAPGASGVTLEYTCQMGDRWWRTSDGELDRASRQGLRRAELTPGAPLGHIVTRQADAYPLYDLGYEIPLRCCLEYVNSLPGLLSTGRQGLFRYGNMDHAVLMGQGAAAWAQDCLSRTEAQAAGTEREYFG